MGIDLGPAVTRRIGEQLPHLEVVVETGAAFDQAIRDAEIVAHWEFSAEQLAAATHLRWFQSLSAGVEGLPLTDFKARGIPLANSSGAHVSNMAEHLLALMLAFARNLPYLLRSQFAAKWQEDDARRGVFELSGQHVLVLGAGRIGEEFARRAAAFGLVVIGVARHTDRPTAATRLATMSELPALLPWADHVAIVLPHTRETERLVNAAFLAQMKPGAFLYNVGRGPIVDTTALTEALASGALGGAGLDVTDPEPLPTDHPLWQMPNVIITAHTAGASPMTMSRVADALIANALAFEAGTPMPTLVDLDAGY